jgi:AcrR family transcriptional regulator
MRHDQVHGGATWHYVPIVDRPDPERIPQKLPRGRHGLPRQFVIASQRERLLDGTARAVGEIGYPALTVQAIIDRAAVSRKTFYEHFSDKEDCFLAAYDAIVEQIIGAVTSAYEGEESWHDRVYAGIRAFLEFLASEPYFARMCIVDVLAAGPLALERRDAAMQAFTLFFEAGRSESPPHLSPPEIAAEAVVGGIYEIIYARVLRSRTDELPDLLPEIMYFALVPYIGRRSAAEMFERAKSVRDDGSGDNGGPRRGTVNGGSGMPAR